MDELRDEVYWWCLNLLEKGFKWESIFLILSTWNFAYFRYHMRDFKLKEFQKTFNNLDFSFFKDKRFETVDLSDREIVEKIKKIYSSLSQFEGVKYVGATKIMHLMNPILFVMWDKKIIEHYKAETTPEGYVDFMKLMQNIWKEGKFPRPQGEETIPRTIDSYNWTKYYLETQDSV